MNMLTKVFVVANAVFALLFLAVVFTLVSKEVSWVKATQDTTELYNTVERDFRAYKLDTEQEVQKLKTEKDAATQRANDLQVRVDNLTQNLVLAQRQVEDEKKRVTSQESIAKSLSEQMGKTQADLKTKSDALERANDDLAKQRAIASTAMEGQRDISTALIAAQDQLRAQAITINDLRKQLKTVREVQHAGGSTLLAPAPEAKIQGKIIDIDLNYRLVELNVGERQGVRKGMEFMIVGSGDETPWMGRVKVVTVTADRAGAHIMPITPDPAKIVTGDTVMTDA